PDMCTCATGCWAADNSCRLGNDSSSCGGGGTAPASPTNRCERCDTSLSCGPNPAPTAGGPANACVNAQLGPCTTVGEVDCSRDRNGVDNHKVCMAAV